MKLANIGNREQIVCLLLYIPIVFLEFFNFPAHYAIVSASFLVVFGCYAAFDNRLFKIATSPPMLIWLALTLYHWINAMTKGVPGVNEIDLLHGFKIYASIAIFAYWASIDFKKTVNILILTYLVRCVVVLFLTVGFGYEESSDRITGAGGSSTGLGQMAAITGIFVVYLNAFRHVTLQKNILLLTLPMLVIVLSMTRNALAMVMISILTISMLAGGTKRISSFRVLTGLLLFALVALITLTLLSDSAFGQRFQQTREDSHFFMQNATGTIFDTIVGDRLVYYVLGWEFFLKNPITGIGMWNFKYTYGGDYPLHSEYMVHLCEGGLIGITLWILFLVLIFRIILKYSENSRYRVAAISSLAVLLFCGIYAREFFYEFFYPPYGLILSFYFRGKWNNQRKRILALLIRHKLLAKQTA